MKNITLCLFLICAGFGSAQHSIRGHMEDSTGTGIPFCVAGLVQAQDSSLLKGALGDESGNFEINSVKSGTYLIKSSQPGYAELFYGPFVKDSTEDLRLPAIRLKPTGVQLKGVDVIALQDPIEFRNGNVTVNIEGSPLAAGNSVFDLLSRLPGVMVDNESISLEGKSGVKVYIDERQQQMSGAQLLNFLRSLSASTVEKIEVISNPPARYDAAGNAGIINIKTKKVKLTGFSGNANLGLSQGYYLGSTAGLSLNYKGKKASFFSSLNANRRMTHSVSRSERIIRRNSGPLVVKDQSYDNGLNEDLVVNLGVDWYATDKLTFGVKYQGIPGFGRNLVNGKTEYSDNSPGFDRIYYTKDMPNDWYLANYNVNGERKLDTLGSAIKLSADYYAPYFDDYRGYYTNHFLDSSSQLPIAPQNFISNNLLDMEILTARLDLHKNLASGMEYEAGLKGSLQEVTSNYVYQRENNLDGVYITDPALTNKFTYFEQIGAAYFSMSKKVGKASLHGGARAEQTELSTRTVSGSTGYYRSYFSFFPQGGVDYNFKSGHRYSINFNRRIERPHYNAFNPYRWFASLITAGEGNPALQPAYSNVLSFNYGYKSMINNTLSFTRITNPIISYVTQNDDAGAISWHVDNLKYLTIVRCHLFARKQVTKWYTQGVLVGAYYIDYSGQVDGQSLTVAAVPYYIWINSVLLLPKNFKVELTGFYWGPWLGIGYRNLDRGGVNIAVKKSFADNKFTVSLSANDIFFTENWRSSAKYRNQDWTRFDSNDTRRFGISLAYNFGKIKAEQRVLDSSSEEKSRLGK